MSILPVIYCKYVKQPHQIPVVIVLTNPLSKPRTPAPVCWSHCAFWQIINFSQTPFYPKSS